MAFDFCGERDVDEALVVPEVEVGLAAVVGDEHLAVLEGVHRARVDVDVRVELLHRDPEAPGLQQPPERGGGEALARGSRPLHRSRRCASPRPLLFRSARRIRARRSDRRRPYHATRDDRADRRSIPCRNDPGRDGRRSPGRVASRARHWRGDAALLAIVAILIRLPAFFASRSLVFDDGVFGVVGAGDARTASCPFRDIFSSQGPLFLPLRLGRRPRRLPHDGRAAGAHASPPACCSTIAVYSCARRITTRGQRAARRRAGHHQRIGALGHRPGQRRRPVARAVGARRSRSRSRYRDDPRLRTAVWVGLAAGAAVSIKALSVPAVVIAGLIVLLSHRRDCDGRRDAAVAAGIAVAVYLVAALPLGSTGCGTSRSRTTRTRRRATRHWGAVAQDRRHAVGPRPARAGRARRWRRSRCVVRVRRRERRAGEAGRPGAHDRRRRPRALDRAGGRRCSSGSRRCGGRTSRTSCRRSRCSRRCGRRRGGARWSPASWRCRSAWSSNRSILWPDGYTGERRRSCSDSSAPGRRAGASATTRAWCGGPGTGRPASSPTRRSSASTQGQHHRRRRWCARRRPRDVCGVIVDVARSTSAASAASPDALAAEGYHPVQFGDRITLYERDTPGVRCVPPERAPGRSAAALGDCARGGRTSAAAAPRR